MWIVRDKVNTEEFLVVLIKKPERKTIPSRNLWNYASLNSFNTDFTIKGYLYLKENLFPEVTLQDKDPKWIRFINNSWIDTKNQKAYEISLFFKTSNLFYEGKCG